MAMMLITAVAEWHGRLRLWRQTPDQSASAEPCTKEPCGDSHSTDDMRGLKAQLRERSRSVQRRRQGAAAMRIETRATCSTPLLPPPPPPPNQQNPPSRGQTGLVTEGIPQFPRPNPNPYSGIVPYWNERCPQTEDGEGTPCTFSLVVNSAIITKCANDFAVYQWSRQQTADILAITFDSDILRAFEGRDGEAAAVAANDLRIMVDQACRVKHAGEPQWFHVK